MKDQIRHTLRDSSPVADPAAVAQARWPKGVAGSLAPEPLIPAAVLLPIIDTDDHLNVMLTRRTDHLRDHPGQISFPGGRVESHDAGPHQTALRETEEEIGLAPEFVEIVGYLEPQPIVTGFAVTPVVGLVRSGFTLRLDEFEVAEVFQVPLKFFLDASNVRVGIRRVGEAELPLVEYEYRHYRIWGATAQIIHSFSKIIYKT